MIKYPERIFEFDIFIVDKYSGELLELVRNSYKFKMKVQEALKEILTIII